MTACPRPPPGPSRTTRVRAAAAYGRTARRSACRRVARAHGSSDRVSPTTSSSSGPRSAGRSSRCGIYGFYVVVPARAPLARSQPAPHRDARRRDDVRVAAGRGATASPPSCSRTSGASRPSSAVLRQQATEFRDPRRVDADLARRAPRSCTSSCTSSSTATSSPTTGPRARSSTSSRSSTRGLGAPVPQPDPSRLKGKHNYVGRIIATIATCGIYALWWQYDVMTEGNVHFEHNWRWEDGLVASVQQLAA